MKYWDSSALVPLCVDEASAALDRGKALHVAWHEVQPSPALRDAAMRLLRVHPLRAADAMQLAAAVIAADRDAGGLELVTLDARLATAAQREGFPVLFPESRAP